MRSIQTKVLLGVLVGISVPMNASVIEDTIKALVDDSYKTEQKITAMQKKINKSNSRIKELETEVARLKVENSVVKIDTKESDRKMPQNEFSNIIVSVWAANLRSRPDHNSSIVGCKEMGKVLKMSEFSKDKKWCKTPKGYIRATLVQPFDINKTITVIPINKTINIRRTTIFKKDNISVTARDVHAIKVFPILFLGKWYKLKNGQGYVHKKVVREVQ